LQQNLGHLNDRVDALQWAATVSLSPLEVEDLKDQSIGVIVSKSVKKQVISALKNYTDIGL